MRRTRRRARRAHRRAGSGHRDFFIVVKCIFVVLCNVSVKVPVYDQKKKHFYLHDFFFHVCMVSFCDAWLHNINVLSVRM